MRHKKIIPVVYCPNCNSDLNDQYGFDPNADYDTWKCENCGMMLINPKYNSDIAWYCDNCGTFMNSQYGFNTDDGTWTCSKCGYDNDVSMNNVYGSDAMSFDFDSEDEEVEEDSDYYDDDDDYFDDNDDDYNENSSYTNGYSNNYSYYQNNYHHSDYYDAQYNVISDKSRLLCLFICYFLGIFGGHYFYVGKTKWGFIYLFTGGLFCFGWMYDLFRILFGNFRDKYGRTLTHWL